MAVRFFFVTLQNILKLFIMSVSNDAIKHAVMVGYRVDKDGDVFYKNRPRKLDFNRSGYKRFRIKDIRKKCVNVAVHRLQGYQKFGEIIFQAGVQIRHLDGNPANNRWGNIGHGTQSDNMMDRSEEDRLAHGRYANSFLIKHDAGKIKHDHVNGLSYSELMIKYDISSKGTMSYIINHR